MLDKAAPEHVRASFRLTDGGLEEDCPWGVVAEEVLGGAAPWRTFRWRKGQKHYSGVFWAATERNHVIYESRLELARLLFADFDTSVRRIVAQPFLLKAEVAGAERRHIPDYLLFTAAGPVVVDVKPRHRLARPKVAFTFTWTKTAVESRGWQYEVWSEPPKVELENIRFLAGYRRDWLFDQTLLNELRTASPDGSTLADVVRSLPQWPKRVVHAHLLHLLWRQDLVTDLSRPLSAHGVLRSAA
ncbi:TnsA-like heteromeric transposase endonuclease subunit [Microbispora sp. NPDC049125]|uniref:TnsA-like heteromeric transposase endonuclease subunit n=1 Tax=Microbispora sp. NPDC049125 TaxID=3154929 RepID=UPI0034655483